MMAWVNSIELSGLVVRDAARSSERAPWRFTLRQSGGKKPDQFFPVASWHDTGGEVKAGQEISVKGSLRHERWTDADGGQRERLTVIAEVLELADQKGERDSGRGHFLDSKPTSPGDKKADSLATIPLHVSNSSASSSTQLSDLPSTAAPLRPVTEQDPITSDDIPF
jgi:single-stranded DNA-binding protein